MLKDNYNKLFESNAKVTSGLKSNAEIYFHVSLYISYHQIKLDENFRVNFNPSLASENDLRTGIQITTYQQTFEINAGMQNEFLFLKSFLQCTIKAISITLFIAATM